MKNVLWYIGFYALIYVMLIVLALIIANIALPIVLMVWLNSGWWLCLWLIEPILVRFFVYIDGVLDDM